MATKTIRYKVTIITSRHSDGDLASLFDMLRYEGAVVRDWSRWRSEGGQGERSGYIVTLEAPVTSYTPQRWQSFGLVPIEV